MASRFDVDPDFWGGKRVLLTGHTGFKGSWLALWLHSMGAQTMGIALAPETSPSLFEEARVADTLDSRVVDIRDCGAVRECVSEFKPEIVIHLAAQALVRRSYKDPLETLTTNVIGLANLLHAASETDSVRAFLNVTSDKCYENDGRKTAYFENDRLGGFDPYSASKACSEIVSSSMFRSFLEAQKVGVATARAGNVIGGGDWSTDRLVPDLIAAFENSSPVSLRNPNHTRPWQYVIEPLSGYLMLTQALFSQPTLYSGPWNFGPLPQDSCAVHQVAEIFERRLGVANAWVVDESQQPHESFDLALDISKASELLGWRPRWRLPQAIDKVVAWHQLWRSGGDARAICLSQILDYCQS